MRFSLLPCVLLLSATVLPAGAQSPGQFSDTANVIAVEVPVQVLRDGELQAEAKVLTAEGQEAGDGEVRVVRRDGRGADGADRVTAAFKAPRLKPGEYLLMITLIDRNGGAETSVTPFVVKSG